MNKISAQITPTENYIEKYIPQANDLNKIVTIIEVLKYSPINEKDIALSLSFSTRQGQYYSDALRFLEIIDTFQYGNHKIIILKKEFLKYFDKRNVGKKLREHIINGMFLDKYKKRIDNMDLEKTTKNRRLKSLKAWEEWTNEF